MRMFRISITNAKSIYTFQNLRKILHIIAGIVFLPECAVAFLICIPSLVSVICPIVRYGTIRQLP